MKSHFQVAAILIASAIPALAQEASPSPSGMTCGEFLALDSGAQMEAMLALRSPEVEETSDEAMPASNEESSVEPSTEGAATEAAASGTETSIDPKLTAMRTSCEGIPEALASDAMMAAHADYE